MLAAVGRARQGQGDRVGRPRTSTSAPPTKRDLRGTRRSQPASRQPIAIDETTKTETYGGGDAGQPGVLGPTGTPTGGSRLPARTHLDERNVRTTPSTRSPRPPSTHPAPSSGSRSRSWSTSSAIGPEQSPTSRRWSSAAAGIDTARGDTVVVNRMPFDTTVPDQMNKELAARQAQAKDDNMLADRLFAAAGAVAARRRLGVHADAGTPQGPAASSRTPRPVEAGRRCTTPSATGVNPRSRRQRRRVDRRADSAGAADLAAIAVERRREERQQVLTELIDNQPDEVAAAAPRLAR